MALASGTQAIGTVKVGQKVLAYNPKTQKMEAEPIVHVWKHTDDDLVDLTLTVQTHAPHSSVTHHKSEVIHTNKKHPFLTVEHGFLNVAHVKVGMHVERADGTVGTVTKWQIVPGIQMMYNLEVAQDHTFTVGAGQWIVHNCNIGDVGSYKDMIKSGSKGDGLTPHHMPQGSLANHFGFNYREGGSIVMDEAEHAKTFNFGGRANGVKNAIIAQGATFRQALAQSIRDYRALVPESNDSVRQLIEYWKDTYPSLMQK